MYINHTKKNYSIKCKLCKGSIQYMEKYWVDIKYSFAVVDFDAELKSSFHKICWEKNEDWWGVFCGIFPNIMFAVKLQQVKWDNFCNIWDQLGNQIITDQMPKLTYVENPNPFTGIMLGNTPLTSWSTGNSLFLGEGVTKVTLLPAEKAIKTVSKKEAYGQLANFMGMIYKIYFDQLSDADARSRLLDLD